MANADIRLPLLPVALLSAAALAHELLLMRLLAIVHWHHFAALVISLALLGFGLGGSLLCRWQQPLRQHFERSFCASAAAFALLAPASFGLAQALPFNALALLWDGRQLWWLLAMIGLLALPFACVGLAIGLSLIHFSAQAPRLYGADLSGAALGALLPLIALPLLSPGRLLLIIATLAAVAAAMIAPHRTLRYGLLLIAIATPLLPATLLQPRPGDYKPLTQALRTPGSRVLWAQGNALAASTLIDAGVVPWRSAPDLSWRRPVTLPAQRALFRDGEAPVALSAGFDASAQAWLTALPSALPYQLQTRAQVLLIQPAGNAPLLQAHHYGASHIDWVESDPLRRALIEKHLAEFSGWVRIAAVVHPLAADARAVLAKTDRAYDLIAITLAEGGYSAGEQFLLTREALAQAWQRLAPTGVLVLQLPWRAPPLEALKGVATADAALTATGVATPAQHLALIKGLRTALLLISRPPFSSPVAQRLQQLATAQGWTPLLLAEQMPHAGEDEGLHAGVRALRGPERDRFVADYPFDLTVASDDRPFFRHFFRYASALALLSAQGRGGLALLDWSHPLLWASAMAALLLSLLLIGLPLRGSPRAAHGAGMHWRYGGYFAAIGLGFMLLEIPLLQRLTLWLGQPLYAAATILALFLFGAGIGSYFAARQQRASRAPFVAIALLISVLLLIGSGGWVLALDLPRRSALIIAVLLPLALMLGQALPLGLKALARDAPTYLPWAWAVNACASVVGALLAQILAIEFGFNCAIAGALGLYLMAALLLPRSGTDK